MIFKFLNKSNLNIFCLQNPDNASILPACYSMLESCIEFMTCGPSLSLDEKQVLQLHNAMTGAFGAVLYFLKENQSEPEKVCILLVTK